MSLTLTISSIAGIMALIGLLLVSRMRLMSMASLFRTQAFLLALMACGYAIMHREASLFIVAAAVIVLKLWLIPRVLLRVAHAGETSQRLESFLRPTAMTFVGILIVCLAFAGSQSIFPTGEASFVVPVASSLILLGFFMLVSRKDMFSQAFGFLVMENGIFTFGLALSGGMPLFVEIGILFDVLVLFMLVSILVQRAHQEHRSVTTDYLRELID